MSHNPLGQQTEYISIYSPDLLFPIDRAASRGQLGIIGDLPFYGVDVWTGYELSWLNLSGKPQVAVAEFRIPCNSEFIIESKSFKLYLNSLNQTRFPDHQAVLDVLTRDLSAVAKAEVSVKLFPINSLRAEGNYLESIAGTKAIELDALDILIEHYHPSPELLTTADKWVDETLLSHLLKTNCPVTGQPDWASIFIAYKGKQIEHENLLRYLISFREHQDFHEHCVERIFCDLQHKCKPEFLSVYARYTRRGGLDINPFRSTEMTDLPYEIRLIRQ